MVVFNLNSVGFEQELVEVSNFQSANFGDFCSNGEISPILIEYIESNVFSKLNKNFVVKRKVPAMIFNFSSFEGNGKSLKGTKTL